MIAIEGQPLTHRRSRDGSKVYREPWQCDDVTYFNVTYFTHGFRQRSLEWQDTEKWVLGCEAVPNGLMDNRSVQDTPW